MVGDAESLIAQIICGPGDFDYFTGLEERKLT